MEAMERCGVLCIHYLRTPPLPATLVVISVTSTEGVQKSRDKGIMGINGHGYIQLRGDDVAEDLSKLLFSLGQSYKLACQIKNNGEGRREGVRRSKRRN